MKNIRVQGLLEVDYEGTNTYCGNIRPKEGSRIKVTVTDLWYSSDLTSLEARYVSSSGEELIYGEAASLIDKAFEKGFSLMVSDEVASIDITIPRHYIGNIPEDLSLSCQVHLIVIEPFKPVYECTTDEKLSFASKYKNLGVALYKEGSTCKQVCACLFFSQSLKWLCMIDSKELSEKEKEIKELKIQCYNNLGLYHIQKGNYSLVIEATTKVLKIDSENVKALYRRAVANTEIQNYEIAEEDLKAALLLDPNNGPIKKQTEEVKRRQRVVSNIYASAMKKFLS